MDYDREFTEALAEEFLKTRIILLLRSEKRLFKLEDLTEALNVKKDSISNRLGDMVNEGIINCSYKNREPFFFVNPDD